MTTNLSSRGTQLSNQTIECFDYQAALKNNQIAYVVSRDDELTTKMLRDPTFSLEFIKDEVAVFMVKPNFN